MIRANAIKSRKIIIYSPLILNAYGTGCLMELFLVTKDVKTHNLKEEVDMYQKMEESIQGGNI